ncbi:hypothetical protein Q604_UNBC18396G0005, partial [human gut metagenome]
MIKAIANNINKVLFIIVIMSIIGLALSLNQVSFTIILVLLGLVEIFFF